MNKRIAVWVAGWSMVWGGYAGMAEETAAETSTAVVIADESMETNAEFAPAPADVKVRMSAIVQYFEWEEDVGGGLGLKEKGPLYGLGASLDIPLTPDWRLDLNGYVYAGTVDYDGFLQNIFGGTTPYESETSYQGFKTDADFVFTGDDGLAGVSMFAGLGMQYWLRELDDGGEFGYDEYWYTLDTRVGLKFQFAGAYPDVTYRGLIGLLLPIYNYEVIKGADIAGDDEVDLEPKPKVGYVAEFGADVRNWHLVAFYEAQHFGKSDLDDSGTVYQPKSDKQVIGVRAGLNF